MQAYTVTTFIDRYKLERAYNAEDRLIWGNLTAPDGTVYKSICFKIDINGKLIDIRNPYVEEIIEDIREALKGNKVKRTSISFDNYTLIREYNGHELKWVKLIDPFGVLRSCPVRLMGHSFDLNDKVVTDYHDDDRMIEHLRKILDIKPEITSNTDQYNKGFEEGKKQGYDNGFRDGVKKASHVVGKIPFDPKDKRDTIGSNKF